jgi:hypothetical protein
MALISFLIAPRREKSQDQRMTLRMDSMSAKPSRQDNGPTVLGFPITGSPPLSEQMHRIPDGRAADECPGSPGAAAGVSLSVAADIPPRFSISRQAGPSGCWTEFRRSEEASGHQGCRRGLSGAFGRTVVSLAALSGVAK